MTQFTPADVSAVVCTMNSLKSIRECLQGLRVAGVGEIIVVDAHSHDGTRSVADELADIVLEDPGIGLGTARNLGIARTEGALVLNCGSDNVITREALETMISTLTDNDLQGVSARTEVEGNDYLARSMNAWWSTRFRPGLAAVIGTPSLMRGDLLRSDPYDTSRQHSDDSELCQRWAERYSARFAIAPAVVREVGKGDWHELALRCRNYGVSDFEVFTAGVSGGWSVRRRLRSIVHPLSVDFLQPLARLGPRRGLPVAPFLTWFVAMRYAAWVRRALGGVGHEDSSPEGDTQTSR